MRTHFANELKKVLFFFEAQSVADRLMDLYPRIEGLEVTTYHKASLEFYEICAALNYLSLQSIPLRDDAEVNQVISELAAMSALIFNEMTTRYETVFGPYHLRSITHPFPSVSTQTTH